MNDITFDDMETMYNKIKTGAANYDVILVLFHNLFETVNANNYSIIMGDYSIILNLNF